MGIVFVSDIDSILYIMEKSDKEVIELSFMIHQKTSQENYFNILII
jgi:hypothetical protein